MLNVHVYLGLFHQKCTGGRTPSEMSTPTGRYSKCSPPHLQVIFPDTTDSEISFTVYTFQFDEIALNVYFIKDTHVKKGH